MGEAIVALIGVAAAAISWWLERQKSDPLRLQVKQLQVDYQELLDKYTRSIGRVKTLEKVVLRQRERLYEQMDTDDLLDSWNDDSLWGHDQDPEDPN